MALVNPANIGSEQKSPQEEEKLPSVSQENQAELDAPYVDKRTVTISLVHNYSAYRRANMKVLGHKKETIGSSIRSCQILSSNAEEIAAYFPALIGISANNPEFITRVKAWLSNIQFAVNDNDVSLDTTFIYNHKRDYLAVKKKEDEINDEFERVNRANTDEIDKALKVKINALNTLESTKYKYGHPENVEEYLIYRHCLLYRDVAKDTALINSSPNVRFYIKDEAKEAEKRRKLVQEKTIAMRNFVELNASDAKFNAVYVAIAVNKHTNNLTEYLLKDKNEKQEIVMNFVNETPDKFNKLVNDKNIQIKAFIETLIARGELVRSEYNQQISTADGTYVGSNMNEAIAWFENPANKDVRTAFENKLKLF